MLLYPPIGGGVPPVCGECHDSDRVFLEPRRTCGGEIRLDGQHDHLHVLLRRLDAVHAAEDRNDLRQHSWTLRAHDIPRSKGG